MSSNDEIMDMILQQKECTLRRQTIRDQCRKDAIDLVVDMARHTPDLEARSTLEGYVNRAREIAQRWADNQDPE